MILQREYFVIARDREDEFGFDVWNYSSKKFQIRPTSWSYYSSRSNAIKGLEHILLTEKNAPDWKLEILHVAITPTLGIDERM